MCFRFEGRGEQGVDETNYLGPRRRGPPPGAALAVGYPSAATLFEVLRLEARWQAKLATITSTDLEAVVRQRVGQSLSCRKGRVLASRVISPIVSASLSSKGGEQPSRISL